MSKIAVGILGATGMVGQRFVELLHNHPWFQITLLAASERSQGKKYKEAAKWLMNTPLPQEIADMTVISCDLLADLEHKPKILFSALDASFAEAIEKSCQQSGYIVVSNARNHRMFDEVPLIVPEVNLEHLALLDKQPEGKILCVPNCSTVGLALALKPLHEAFVIEKLHVVTMQAISGAGYPGVASYDIFDNVIPYIGGEEQKMETELLKLLGTADQWADIKVSAQCNRVPVVDGHTECVSLQFKHKPTKEALIEAWKDFPALDLPLAPLKPIWYHPESNYPQPKLHRHLDKAMAVHVGRLQECAVLDYKFTLLSHNTVRGAAGGGVLIAELMVKQGLVSPLFEEIATLHLV